MTPKRYGKMLCIGSGHRFRAITWKPPYDIRKVPRICSRCGFTFEPIETKQAKVTG